MTAAAGTSGPWAEWKRVNGTPIYVWKGPPQHGELLEGTLPGLPTAQDFRDAPMFTIFPGRAPTEKLSGDHDSFVDADGYEQAVWFLSHVGTLYSDEVREVLEKAALLPGQDIEFDVEIDGEVAGHEIPFRGRQHVVFDDNYDIFGYAVEKGYTVIKVPDSDPEWAGDAYRLYSIDPYRGGKKSGPLWEQTHLLSELGGGAPAGGDPELLKKVNRYRRSVGQTRDLQPGEWSDQDIEELLSHAPKRYQNPQDARYQELKRSLMR